MVAIQISLLVAVIIFVILVAMLMKKFMILAVNSVIGFFALVAASLVLPSLKISIWSVLITAIGGIIGFAAVIILHLFGISI